MRLAILDSGHSFGTKALFAFIRAISRFAFSLRQRTREIGIRMALGASASDIHRLFLREGLVPSGIGLGLGLILAVGLARLLATFI
jgi:putative ABC transport system permease protein